MTTITVEEFIKDWIPEHIKNKILHYAIESPLLKETAGERHLFRFGEKIYNTNSTNCLENFLPFRNHEFYKKIKHPSTTIFNIHVPRESRHDFIVIKKVMKTHTNELDIIKMKNTGHMVITRQNGRRKIIECRHLNPKSVKSFEYINSMELANFPCGLLLSEKETLYAYYTPYSNGFSRKYTLYRHKLSCRIDFASTIITANQLWTCIYQDSQRAR